MIFHSGSFPCSFIRCWTPASGKKLVKNSPPNMMRPKRHCTTRLGKIIIFDYFELLYKGVYIHTAQRCLLNPLKTFPTPKVKFTWLQRPWWRAIFRNIAILDIIPVIYCKLVSQVTLLPTKGRGKERREERCVMRKEQGGGRLHVLIGWILVSTTLGPWKATFSNLAAWLVSTLIKTLNFVSFSSSQFWDFFLSCRHVTTLHFQIPVIIGSRTHKPFGTSLKELRSALWLSKFSQNYTNNQSQPHF